MAVKDLYVRSNPPVLPESQPKYLQEELRKIERAFQFVIDDLQSAGGGGVTQEELDDVINDLTLIDNRVTTIETTPISADDFADNITPVEIVSSLPSTGNFIGRIVVLTSDGKLYRWDGSQWVAVVNSADIVGQVTNAQIVGLEAGKVTGQLTDAQLASIAAAKVAGQLTEQQIAQGAITALKIADGAIQEAKLAVAAVTEGKLAAGSVVAGKIAAGAVVADAIAANAVVASKIAASAITTEKLAAGSITTAKIAAAAIETGQIAAGAVVADSIAANAITTPKIAAGAVVTASLAAGSVQAANIAAGAVVAGKIGALAVTAENIAADAIIAGKIAAGAVSADKLAANNVITSSAQISDGIITNAKIGNIIQSSNYSAGSAGWQLDKAGNAEFNNVTVRGDLRSSSLYTGSIYKDATSNEQIFSLASTTHVNGYIADAGAVSKMYTHSSMRIYGPSFHGSVPVNQRARATSGSNLITVTFVVNAIVDHYFSVWYRYNTSAPGIWLLLGDTVEASSADGTVCIFQTARLGLADNAYIELGVASVNANDQLWSASKPYIKYLYGTMLVSNL